MTLTNGSMTHEESDVEKVLIIPDTPELLDSELNIKSLGVPRASRKSSLRRRPTQAHLESENHIPGARAPL